MFYLCGRINQNNILYMETQFYLPPFNDDESKALAQYFIQEKGLEKKEVYILQKVFGVQNTPEDVINQIIEVYKPKVKIMKKIETTVKENHLSLIALDFGYCFFLCNWFGTDSHRLFYTLISSQKVEDKQLMDELAANIFKDIVSPVLKTEDKKMIGVISCNQYGRYQIDEMELTNFPDTNISKQYNDDFAVADKTIKETIENGKSGVVILHGKQGTGKTTYIRNLIKNTKKKFLYLPNSLVAELTRPQFISFLTELKDSVFILEDCENAIRSRDTGQGNSSAISNILNLSDGLLGDIYKFKFICTFNASIQKIDKALLRKGRLDYIYNFKDLSAEKTDNLLKELGHEPQGKPMTLADIYNFGTDNSVDENIKPETIGYK